MRALLLAAGLAMLATHAAAQEPVPWPPPGPVQERMRELRAVIASRESPPAQRAAAREELAGLIKSPAGKARGRTPGEKPSRPARAGIEPYPSVVKPANVAPAPPPPAGVAQVEVVVPPKPVVDPRTGAAAAPSARFAIDPRTGAVLHETPAGYVDPQTGRIVPR